MSTFFLKYCFGYKESTPHDLKFNIKLLFVNFLGKGQQKHAGSSLSNL